MRIRYANIYINTSFFDENICRIERKGLSLSQKRENKERKQTEKLSDSGVEKRGRPAFYAYNESC